MDAIILIGIQGSGKTTFYRQRYLETHVRISLDLLRTRNREQVLLDTCLRIGQPFVIDNTNVTVAERARYIAPALAARCRVLGYFFEPDPKAAYARNVQRPERGRIPAAGVFGTLKRLERPALAEGFDELYRVWVSESGEFRVENWQQSNHASIERASG